MRGGGAVWRPLTDILHWVGGLVDTRSAVTLLPGLSCRPLGGQPDPCHRFPWTLVCWYWGPAARLPPTLLGFHRREKGSGDRGARGHTWKQKPPKPGRDTHKPGCGGGHVPQNSASGRWGRDKSSTPTLEQEKWPDTFTPRVTPRISITASGTQLGTGRTLGSG